MTVNGIRFDGLHSYYDFGMWLSERPDTGVPEPKTNQIEIPGADGTLDMTEANSGEVKFTNRIMTLTFAAMVDVDQQERFKAHIRNYIHGKKIKQIILDEDPEWYYTGRASVEFTEIKPWKLKIIITVDAQPYAMRLTGTVVDITPTDFAETEFQIGEDSSVQSWNSNFMFGSQAFPTGDFSAYDAIEVRWTDQSEQGLFVPSINIADADGNAYSVSIPSFQSKLYRVTMNTLSQAGLDVSKIYRVLVSSIGGCELYAIPYDVFETKVWNERKTVMPVVTIDTTAPGVQITLNGIMKTLYEGENQTPEFMLTQGWNSIVIHKPDEQYAINQIVLSYREGKV